MTHQRKNKIKALFLLTVFSLNTVVGFACSVGVNMGFNSKHHHHEEATEAVVHIHRDGSKHNHHEKKDSHHQGKSHHYDQAKNHHHSKEDKDNCCNDTVVKFAELDKAVPQTVKANMSPVFVTAFLASFYNINIFIHSQSTPDIKQFVRSYHPPIPDIRIAIQSFQI